MSKITSTDSEKQSVFLTVLKGSLFALSISLVLILIFAFILRFVPIKDEAIAPVNQVIKGISVLIGTLVAMRKCKEMGLITGLLIGLFYTVFAFITFSILDRQFNFSPTIFNDLVFGAIIGAICGIIAVNLRKKKC